MIKTSRLTKYFVGCFLTVCVLKHFYNVSPSLLSDIQYPISEAMDMISSEIFRERIPSDTILEILCFLAPLIGTMNSILEYGILLLSSDANNSIFFMLIGSLVFCVYMVLSYICYKLHSKYHKDEKWFTVCVDMTCIENVIMYIINILLYHFAQVFIHMKMRDTDWIKYIAIPMMILVDIIAFGFLVYTFIGYICSMALTIPGFIFWGFMPRNVDERIVSITLFILFVISSQIIWRKVSDKLLNKADDIFQSIGTRIKHI